MKTGLRTEIVVSISLLLGAALLFAGFLLVKLTEQELLEQQRIHSRTTMNLFLAMLKGLSEPVHDVTAQPLANRIFSALDNQPGILGWRLLDNNLQVIASLTSGDSQAFSAVPEALLNSTMIHESLVYSSGWLPWQTRSASYLDMTTAVPAVDSAGGLLQVRFSLDALVARVHRAQRLIAVYVVLYGVILTVFGVYLLNRNVVMPIRRLQEATTEVAGGKLAQVESGHGPGEITELANSFNRMVNALKKSRSETEAHIHSLEEANRALTQAHNDLIRSEKMASVGHLAAGMAHEIGNPLGALTGYLGVLQADLAEDAAEADLVSRALAESQRIDKLVRELLDYASPGVRQDETFSPVTLLRETVTMLGHQGSLEGMTLDDACPDEIGPVCMDRRRLQQVWVNLLLNARDAMAGHGTVHLSASDENSWVTLTVADEGPGIASDDLEKIFEPFYTTKDPGKGRGLGLAVCQRIIDEAGGRIEVISEPGRGTSFRVSLPRTEEKNR